MYDELYAAGLDEITGYDAIVGNVPYAAGNVPYAAGAQGWGNGSAQQHAALAQHHANMAASASNGGGFSSQVPAGNQIAYGGQIGVAQRKSEKPRLYPLGFVQLAIAASTQVSVTSRPQILFRPQRLVIPAAIGANFVITDIRVGKDSQFVQATEIPASVFSETAVGVMMTLDTAQVANDITLTVRNTDGAAAHDFRATLFGAAVDN